MAIETRSQIELEFQHAGEILTTAEVARELRVSKAHIHNLINGKVHGAIPLPSITLGRRRLIRRASLNQWLRANEHTHLRMISGDAMIRIEPGFIAADARKD
jgi:excisionase family DNA binding protein